MQGGVNYNGSTLLTGGINVNTTGNIQALNVQITENGERTITPPEGVDGYAPITIDTNVPQPTPVLDDITITANGTYTPPSGVDGYDEITVNVSQEADIQPLTRTITTNSTTVINASDLNVDGFNPVTITTAVDGYTIKTLANTPLPIASFNDGTDNPLKSLTASIVPVQDLHGYDSPWVGGAGKNKLNTNIFSDTTYFTINSDGSVTQKMDDNRGESSITTLHMVAGEYIISRGASIGSMRVYANVGGNWTTFVNTSSKNATFTLSADCDLYIKISVSGTYPNTFYPMIRLASVQDATFAPYSNICPINGWTEEVITVTDDLQNPTVTHTTTIPFTDGQGQSVAVFGGELDVVNGTSGNKRTHEKITLNGSENWDFYRSDGSTELNSFRCTPFSDIPKEAWSPTTKNQAICNMFEVSGNAVYSHNAQAFAIDNNSTLFICTNKTSISDFTTWLSNNNVEIRYELATPTTFYTQPTSIKSLDGENIVSASTGDVEELKYFADL